MKFEKFEDIVVWQKAGSFSIDVYHSFKDNRDFSFCDQIKRAVISIMNNIAEGYERKYNKEFARFLFIAKGSCGEVRSMLYVAYKLGYIDSDLFKNYKSRSIEISKMLSGLIKTL